MTDLEKKYSKLREQLTMLEFANELDINTRDEIEKELSELEDKRLGWCVELSRVYPGNTEPTINYLTDSSILCLCEEPTYFETMKEAQEYLLKADIDLKDFDVKFIEVCRNDD